jgi:cell wall-associated NlpC family hydrolase
MKSHIFQSTLVLATLLFLIGSLGCDTTPSNPVVSSEDIGTATTVPETYSDIPDELIKPIRVNGEVLAPQAVSPEEIARLQVELKAQTAQAAPAGTSWITVTWEADSWLGVPYLWGGNSRSGIDCSHLVYQVYRASGAAYPSYLTVAGIKASPNAVRVNQPSPGDLVLFENARHVGIYMGNGYMIDANGYYEKVVWSNLRDSYWQSVKPYFARWVLGKA